MNIYQNNLQEYREKSLKLENALKGLSVLRLLAFVCSLILIIVLANQRLTSLLYFVFPICAIAFALLIRYYNRIAYQKQHFTFLKEVNEDEFLRLENRLSGFPTGQKFIKRDHPYIADLDIFGSHSLFQLINRTTTASGSQCLAEWLSELASKKVIVERQQAIKELNPKFEWRQDFQASGMHFRSAKSDAGKLLTWIEKPVQLLPHQSRYLILTIILSILSLSALIYHFLNAYTSGFIVSTIPLVLILTVNYLVIKKIAPISEEIIDSTSENIKILGGLYSLIKKIESEKFHSSMLCRLQSVFRREPYSAAKEINRLKRVLEMFEVRGTKSQVFGNQFYSIFNFFLLLDIYWILLTEKWKSKNSSYFKEWLSAIGEFEALSSIAGFSYSNPSFTFPEIKEDSYAFNLKCLDIL